MTKPRFTTARCSCWPLFFTLLAITGIALAGAGDPAIRFGYIGAKEHSAFYGVQQGLDEANLQGQFLGQRYELDILAPDRIKPIDSSRYIALLVAADQNALLELQHSAPGVPVFNLTMSDDSLREMCLENIFHIIPSEQMRRDAAARWQQQHPDAQVEARAWHHAYEKYAGRDLNKRFGKTFGKNMDDFAWSGWAAVKMTADTLAREPGMPAAQMINYLKTELLFDGQKGIDMNFQENGQLRQPLLFVAGDKLAGEEPAGDRVTPGVHGSQAIPACHK